MLRSVGIKSTAGRCRCSSSMNSIGALHGSLGCSICERADRVGRRTRSVPSLPAHMVRLRVTPSYSRPHAPALAHSQTRLCALCCAQCGELWGCGQRLQGHHYWLHRGDSQQQTLRPRPKQHQGMGGSAAHKHTSYTSSKLIDRMIRAPCDHWFARDSASIPAKLTQRLVPSARDP